MTFNCLGQSSYQNGAQCYQDSPICPQRSICICPPCFYGFICQFSTSGFGLSLDSILSYHIQPNVKLTEQSTIVMISLIVTIIFNVIGLVNGSISLITFKNRIICEDGCGLYLVTCSVSTLLITILFGLKFWIFPLAQMKILMNKSFLLFQCHSIDFLLRCCLNMYQWLNACISIERAITIQKGIYFNKAKSRQTAKLIILILILFIICTNILDPIYRHIIEEDDDNNDEKRLWCIVSYSSSLQTFNYFLHIFHFTLPFLCNIISSIILITKRSDQISTIQTHRSRNQILREQFQKHKRLLIAPIVLIILDVPRIIILFISKCMKSADDSWLFLFGYFISFVPSMVTFVVFILPSKFYMEEFKKTRDRYRSNIRKYFSNSLQR